LNRRSEPDVVGQGGEHEPRFSLAGRVRWVGQVRRPTWLPATAQRRLGLLLAFALGVAAGCVGWHRWDSAAQARAERATVALVAWASHAAFREQGPQPIIEMYVRLHNSGPLPIQITGLELDQPGLTPQDTLPAKVDVRADATVTMSASSALRCDEIDQSRTPAVIVRALPADERIQERRVPLADLGDLAALTSDTCGSAESGTLEIGLSYSGGAVVTGTGHSARLRAPITAEAWTPTGPEVRLTGVRSTNQAFAVQAKGLPVTVSSDLNPMIELVWWVADCRAAAELDAGGYSSLMITGDKGGQRRERTEIADVGPDLLLALVRFVSTACG
jgi:hypothetical protein